MHLITIPFKRFFWSFLLIKTALIFSTVFTFVLHSCFKKVVVLFMMFFFRMIMTTQCEGENGS